ncbi:MAG: DsbA family protein [Chloroflexaceae bacterium]|nr:DsbA family protein [Chloroflexaceae bacterium]
MVAPVTYRYSLLLVLAMLLTACGGSVAPPAPVVEQPPLARLPTVTPELPTVPPPPTEEAPAPTAPPTVPPAATAPPAPTATPGLKPETYATLGDPNAPITIYEFSDFGCPSCRQYNLFTFPTLREQYIDTGKVYYVYKNYPIVSSNGGLAAQAAECAGEQQGYWAMHAQLFRDPAAWNGDEASAVQVFSEYATALGLDGAVLAQCVSEGRYKADVDSDFEEGLDIGIFGTPTFIINRKLLSGAQSANVFIEVIEGELAGR